MKHTMVIFTFFIFTLISSFSLLLAETEPPQTWESQVAGKFYPGNEAALKDQINEFLKEVSSQKSNGRPLAIISPHAGYVYSGQVAAYGYSAIKGHGFKRVIVLSPSHSGRRYRGASILKADSYKTPLGKISIDQKACDYLLNTSFTAESKNKRNSSPLKLFGDYDGAYKGEHSLETQLPFLQMTLGDFNLVPIMIGILVDNDFDKVAEAIRPLLDDKTLLVVSSDFTHYGDAYRYVPFRENVEENIKILDYGAFEKILNKDFGGLREYRKQTGINACGILPISILLKLLPDSAKGHILHYDTSGHQTNNFVYSVSYASILFTKDAEIKSGEYHPQEEPQTEGQSICLSEKEKKTLLSLARNTLETYANTGASPEIDLQLFTQTPRLFEKYGVFVTLKKQGQLRGCIGYILPKTPLYQEVVENTINSSAKDNRFLPVTHEEINDIDIEISVLSQPRKINGPEGFTVGQEGIVIRKGYANAVFLPHVAAEQGWDKTETLQHLCKKAGLPINAWRDNNMEFFVFTADIFHEAMGI
ncbi:AmmeMemoRadiSam system protein B [Candidatus Kuenenia sp.]|uniref:AmmeMemoRadiSam system protein B n=1 Tax=Candidatus Kuenenia sp. TaxID=2499824 RepID=UPI0032202D58